MDYPSYRQRARAFSPGILPGFAPMKHGVWDFSWDLFQPNDRVLVAVSGGPDSLSLLHALHAGREAHGLGEVWAAHLDHSLRGAESAAEAAWVREWCTRRNIPCFAGRADVAALADAEKISRQQAARQARYAFLEDCAAQAQAVKIATGHTRDDHVETVLLNILRGTGLAGLGGIPRVRGRYVRPLRGVSRAETEAYCAAHGLHPRQDPSNFSATSYSRNRIRLDLLPRLRQDYNAGVDNALLRLSQAATLDADYLRGQAEHCLAEVTRAGDPNRLRLDRAALLDLHPALRRHVLRAALQQMRGTGEGVTFTHLEQLCAALETPGASPFGLTLPDPSCSVRVTANALTISQARAISE